MRDGVDGVIVGDLAALTEALLGLAADAERREELAAQALAGSDRFDQSHRIAEMLELYRDAIAH